MLFRNLLNPFYSFAVILSHFEVLIKNIVSFFFLFYHTFTYIKHILSRIAVQGSSCMYLSDACLCMGELLAPAAPPAPHFVFLITL